jgi:hypothetical protein
VIILDTNVIPNGPAAGNVVFPVLEVVASHAGQRLAVPKIVVEESCERLRRELLQAHEHSARGAETVRKYLGTSFSPRPVDSFVVPNWREYLERVFVVLDAADGAHEEALLREAQRRPPTRDGRGARDALVWLTVLAAQAHEETTYFVSSNGKDFGKDGLLPTLRAEIPEGSNLIYCTSLADLLGRLATRSPRPLSRADVEGSEAVREAIRLSLTGPPWFFEVFTLAVLERHGKALSAGGIDVMSVSVEDSASYEVAGKRFAGARCRVVTRHHLTATSIADTAAQDNWTESLEIQTEPLLFLERNEDGSIERAQVLQQTQPLRRVFE